MTVYVNEIMGIHSAMHGMRNPMNSWDKNDTIYDEEIMCDFDGCSGFDEEVFKCGVRVGPNDRLLASTLAEAGPSHRKFMRQIFVSMDILAPLYWWKEFDTYKVGTTANSCSTMHTIMRKEFSIDDFSHDKMLICAEGYLEDTIDNLNYIRRIYMASEDAEKKKACWYSIIQLLPSSYNQARTVTMSYENLRNIYEQRKNHKLTEWHVLCHTIERLPYSEWIIGNKEEDKTND